MRIDVAVSEPLSTTRRTLEGVEDIETLLDFLLEVVHDMEFDYVKHLAAETNNGNVFWSKEEHDDIDW